MKIAVENILLSILITFFYLCTQVSASPITFQYSGHLNYLPSTGSLPNDFSGQFYLGQTFSGYFTFDSASPITDEYLDTKAYSNSINLYTIEFTGGLFAKFNNGGMAVADDRVFATNDIRDAYVANAQTKMPATVTTNIVTQNWTVQEIYMYFADFSATMLDTDAIPMIAPDIFGTMQIFFLKFKLNGGTATYELYGQIDSLTAVPEPASILLFSSGLIGLAVFKRNIRKYGELVSKARL
jgi:hypothetical protein